MNQAQFAVLHLLLAVTSSYHDLGSGSTHACQPCKRSDSAGASVYAGSSLHLPSSHASGAAHVAVSPRARSSASRWSRHSASCLELRRSVAGHPALGGPVLLGSQSVRAAGRPGAYNARHVGGTPGYVP